MMKRWMGYMILVLSLPVSLLGCENVGKTQMTAVVESQLVNDKKLVPINKEETFSYCSMVPLKEETISTYKTANGLARIDKKSSYYEVFLDFEKGDHYDVGYAYGEAIREIYPNFADMMEPYIYENIYSAFPELTDNFKPVTDRVDQMMASLSPEYQEEIKGFADSLASDESGFKMDKELSKEELNLIHFIPDVLRETQCSGMAAYGDKSVTGETITIRVLEWIMGNENQMATAHAVVHFINGNKSFTSYGVLGLLEVISASNTKGVFGAILDAPTEEAYEIMNKKSYTFALRYALENMGTAKEVGDYMNEQTQSFTFSHNILITDPKVAYVAEDCIGEKGISALRTDTSELVKGLDWHNKDAIAVVNGYALKGNDDNMTDSDHNMIRWKKMDEGLAAYQKVSAADMMDIVTKDDPNAYGSHLYSDYTYQVIVIDAAKGSVDIAFAPACDDYPEKPQFIRVKDDLYSK